MQADWRNFPVLALVLHMPINTHVNIHTHMHACHKHRETQAKCPCICYFCITVTRHIPERTGQGGGLIWAHGFRVISIPCSRKRPAMGMIPFSLQGTWRDAVYKATDQGAERARQEPVGFITFKVRSWWPTSTWQVPLSKGSTAFKILLPAGHESTGLRGHTARPTRTRPLLWGFWEGYTRLWRGTPAPSQALSLSSEDLNIHAWTYICEAQLPPLKVNNTVYSEPHISGCGPGARLQAVPNGMLQHGSSHTNFFWLQNKVRAFTKCAGGGAK